MIYRQAGQTGIGLSIIGLGGHEYLPDGRSRGFNEDFRAAVQPGYRGDGYGGENRRRVLKAAFEAGINFLDVTIDPEKEALGRNLREIVPPYEVFVQTRPEGMGYAYDPQNRQLAQFPRLKAEVVRILQLLRRECIDFLNIPFLQWALDADAEYLSRIGENVSRLKAEGLIRFATADTFSGQATYLAQVEAGCFDALAMNFNFVDAGPAQTVIPRAEAAGMAVITREVFLKGRLFQMGEEAGIPNRDVLARVGLKWNLAISGVTTALVGADDVAQLQNSLSVLAESDLTGEEAEILARLTQTPTYAEVRAQKEAQFWGSEK